MINSGIFVCLAFCNLLAIDTGEKATSLTTFGASAITVVVVLSALAAAVFLYFRVKRERNRYIAEKLKVPDMSKKAFDEMLTRKIKVAKKDTHFAALLIKILGGKDLFKSLGEKQYFAVISELKERIYSVIPKDANVCVYAEDLLAVFIDEELDDIAASSLAEFCIDKARETITLITKVKVSLQINIGIARYVFEQNLTPERFMANVQHALLSAEKSGANTFKIHASAMEFIDDESANYYKDLKGAIERDEFTLHYQPIKKLDGEIIAYESLLRWNHNEYGLIKANKFIPILIQSGLIDDVGLNMFEKLCVAASGFYGRRVKKGGGEVLFSVNVSTRQMLVPNFPDALYRIVKKHRPKTGAICIEISDFKNSAVLENVKKLKDYGFKVAVDGFDMAGSAATLVELQTFSPEWIKLPIAFISECKNNFFARGMVDMFVRYSESDNVKIIATGVEKKEQAEYVKSLKINYAQGTYFADESPDLP